MSKQIIAADYVGPDRRDHNGRDWTSLKAWAQAIGIVGIPGAMAFYLIYMGANELPRIARQQDALAVEMQQQREKHKEVTELINALIRVTQRTCSNAARDENARQKCFDK